MSEQGFYGEEMARHFHSDISAPLIAPSVRHAPFAITRARYDLPGHGVNDVPLPELDAFVFSLQLRTLAGYRTWSNGKETGDNYHPAGTSLMVNMNLPLEVYFAEPFDSLCFYLGRSTLDDLCEDVGVGRIDSFHCDVGVNLVDPVVKHLGDALLPVLERPHEASQLFVDHTCWALRYHLAHQYAELRDRNTGRGGLTPRQLARAKELLTAQLDGSVALELLARECGLSRSHFARAFRKTTGMPPHRWQLQQRTERAKALLRGSRASLQDIARACGFADQSHLTRVFTAKVGVTPGVFRRTCRL